MRLRSTDYRLQTRRRRRNATFTLTAKRQCGFTLIELLVVISIFAIMLLVINQILFSTFSGASKSEATNKVKREGEKTLGVMERSIRNARQITACDSNRVSYVNPQGATESFNCVAASGSTLGSVAWNSAALTSSDVDVSSCSIACDTVSGNVKVVIISATFTSNATSPRAQERGTVTLQSRILLRN